MKIIIKMLILLGSFSMLLTGCGGGGGDGGSQSSVTRGTVYSTYASSSVTIANLYGSSLTICHVDTTNNEVYIGSATVDANGNFTIPNIVKYGTNTKVASATGTGSATTATVTITPVVGTPYTITLNLDTSNYSGVYVGSYTGSTTGEFVSGISGTVIRGFSGNATDGYSSHSTSLSGSSFSATSTNGTLISGTVSTSGTVSGTWNNAPYSGNFSGTIRWQ